MQLEFRIPKELAFKEKSFEFVQSLGITDLTLQDEEYLDLYQLITNARGPVCDTFSLGHRSGVGIFTKLPSVSHVQPKLRFTGVNISLFDSSGSIPPWTWHWTEKNLGEKLGTRSALVNSRVMCVSKPQGISTKSMLAECGRGSQSMFFSLHPY
jgi:hypothetical protein